DKLEDHEEDNEEEPEAGELVGKPGAEPVIPQVQMQADAETQHQQKGQASKSAAGLLELGIHAQQPTIEARMEDGADRGVRLLDQDLSLVAEYREFLSLFEDGTQDIGHKCSTVVFGHGITSVVAFRGLAGGMFLAFAVTEDVAADADQVAAAERRW